MSDSGEGPAIGWIAPPSPVVKRLMIINGVMFLTQLLAQLTNATWIFKDYVALSGLGMEHFRVWQLVSYMFLHNTGNLLHILFNLLALWMFGRDVEYEIGPLSFLKLYFLGGIVGGVTWLAFNFQPLPDVPGLPLEYRTLMGASAGVYAILIAFATLFPERPITLLILFVLPVTMKAKYWAWIAIAFVVYGSIFAAGGTVADLAHLGGIVVGYLYIKWLGYGHAPGWLAAIHRLVPRSARPRNRDYDEFHSSRPGVAYNHPYRSFEEEEEARTAPKRKGLFGKVLPSREQAPEPEEVDKEVYIQKEIDPILDKIARQGMGSLTRRERKILESAKDKIDKRR